MRRIRGSLGGESPRIPRGELAWRLQRNGSVGSRLVRRVAGTMELLALLMVPACSNPGEPTELAEVDRESFDRVVYPLLLRDCGFPACHASSGRFFRVHGPGRARLDGATPLGAEPTPEEIALAYERARSMVSPINPAEASLLLRKPLELEVGGAPHRAHDQFGRDVYPNQEHPNWRTLQAWVAGDEL